jgi:hypothetical protein
MAVMTVILDTAPLDVRTQLQRMLNADPLRIDDLSLRAYLAGQPRGAPSGG